MSFVCREKANVFPDLDNPSTETLSFPFRILRDHPTALRTAQVLLLMLLLCSWHLDRGHNDNTMSRALAVAALVEHGSLEITAHHELTGDKAVIDGRYYSDKAPLPTLVVAPLWWLGKVTGLVQPGEHGYFSDGLLQLGGFLCGSLSLALIITLCWQRSGRVEGGFSPALLSTLPFLGSFLFVYSGSFYNHLPGALFALLAARGLEARRPGTAGLWAGAAIACESALALFAIVWTAQLIARPSAMLRFALGLTPAAVLVLVHNALVTGDPLVFPNAFAVNYGAMHQRYGFGTWQPEAFWGLTFSAYRGLFHYAPALLVLFPLAFGRRRIPAMRSWVHDPYILPAVVLVLAFFTHATWWGGWSYGPRYLTAAFVLPFVRLLPALSARRTLARITIVLSVAGLACAFLAKSTIGYALPTGNLQPLRDEVLPKVAAGAWTGMQWPVELGLSPAASSALFAIVLPAALLVLWWRERTPRPLP